MDCDFLSSFLKINRIELVKQVYHVDQIIITQAVDTEISKTRLKVDMDRRGDIYVETVDPEIVFDDPNLGLGERESIALATQYSSSVLLMSDKKAVRIAMEQGVNVTNIPIFLSFCKAISLLTISEIAQIIDDLATRNGYQFRSEDRNHLLASNP
ncbi:MAG: hypothetical protein ACE1ZS_02705 [Candidatus Poribacteria bacterium]